MQIVEEIIAGSAQGARAIENTRYLVSRGRVIARESYPALRANHALLVPQRSQLASQPWPPYIGAGMAQALITAVELIRARKRDSLYGEWLYAVQPVYYLTRHNAPNKQPPLEERWHIHRLEITPSWRGLKALTVDAPGKLQWVWYPRLKKEFFLTGIWRSTRKNIGKSLDA